ncbi:hypothetical protein BO79DRAFT_46846 [Aspergillus costaricaensis CBS 115574]|uniref:Uncharacterized protein n=1 Tax=Aspergillus costaricaensis CBS 115574 TaxID=1448317 RepID=A0ACD1I597_9EURO|nr:hypothetical protein BO79DRAFT_46846 [Aspergillus costaricaensis CBS 115574]RAK85534.1 hypothetical protein BO79DRAFT_46846 [Aspergillus costaricaensis CBS 115574]
MLVEVVRTGKEKDGLVQWKDKQRSGERAMGEAAAAAASAIKSAWTGRVVGQERGREKGQEQKIAMKQEPTEDQWGPGWAKRRLDSRMGSHGWSPMDGLVAASPGSKTRHWRMKPIRLPRRFPRIGHSASGSDWRRWVS